jgi:hypothetical protein
MIDTVFHNRCNTAADLMRGSKLNKIGVSIDTIQWMLKEGLNAFRTTTIPVISYKKRL